MDDPGPFARLERAILTARLRDAGALAIGAVCGVLLAAPQNALAGLAAGMIVAALLRLAFSGSGWREAAAGLKAPPLPAPETVSGRDILDRLPVPFLILDASATVRFCSLDARALLARAPTGQHISAIFRAPSVLQAVEDALKEERSGSLEFKALRPRERELRATIRVLHSGAERQVVLALQDISQLRQIDAMRMDFVANASHELRTPLAAISGMVETLQCAARNDPVNRDRFLGIIEREAARMARLVDDLLSLSRIEMQVNIAPKAVQNLRQVVSEACNATATLAAENGNTLEVDLGDDPLPVLGERDELLQVFQNLISNAIKYGGSDRPIEIVLDREPARIGITVRDYGDGIDSALVPRLTERFFRINKRESVSRGGTGLGLAIVKHIMSRHRGTLAINSVLGEGSRFTAWFPTVQSTSDDDS